MEVVKNYNKTHEWGLLDNDKIVVGGTTGSLKTTFSYKLAEYYLNHGYDIFIFNPFETIQNLRIKFPEKHHKSIKLYDNIPTNDILEKIYKVFIDNHNDVVNKNIIFIFDEITNESLDLMENYGFSYKLQNLGYTYKVIITTQESTTLQISRKTQNLSSCYFSLSKKEGNNIKINLIKNRYGIRDLLDVNYDGKDIKQIKESSIKRFLNWIKKK